MGILQPTADTTLNVPDHSLSHRVFANDESAPVKAVVVTADGDIKLGDESTNYTMFDDTGHQTMLANARPWRDELQDAINIKNTGTPGVNVDPAEATVTFTHTAGLTDFLFCNVQLNHDRDLTSKIYPHIHFFQAEDAAPNFMLQYRWQKNGAAKVTLWTDLKCNTLVHAYSAGIHQIATTAAGIAVPSGTTLSDIVQFRIIRDHSNDNSGHIFAGDDPYTATVHVLAFDVHLQIDSLGSTDEYTK